MEKHTLFPLCRLACPALVAIAAVGASLVPSGCHPVPPPPAPKVVVHASPTVRVVAPKPKKKLKKKPVKKAHPAPRKVKHPVPPPPKHPVPPPPPVRR